MKVKSIKFLVLLTLMICYLLPNSAIAAGKVYTLSPTSKPYKGNMTNFSTYNKYTKQYYLLRSYLERLEKIGGGTLILKKGTYSISKTLYVPSNVTIQLKDGTKIVKSNYTGTKKVGPSNTLFQFVKPSLSLKKGVRGKYDGEKNISFIGEGSATIDLNYSKEVIAIVAGHNRNIKIQNIHFKNLNSGHFLEIDASDTVLVSGNYFTDSKASKDKNKEAINLDTPDRSTKGWDHDWSKYDKTPNRNVTIKNNVFYNLDRAIGTHKYSAGKYHDKVYIQNNCIEQTRTDAIRVMNWSNAVIEGNTIKNVAARTGKYRGIFASGALNPTFRKNTIEYTSRPIEFMPWKNSGSGSTYPITYDRLSQTNIDSLKTNYAINTIEPFIRINKIYNKFGGSIPLKFHCQLRNKG